MSDSNDTTVEYRDIPGFPGYRVGSDGSVWTCKSQKRLGRGKGNITYLTDKWRRLNESISGDGRLVVTLCPNPRQYPTHRLVLLAFRGPCPDGMEACHNDGDHLNNRIDNLRWDTRKSNSKDAIRHGVIIRGEKSHLSKLTEGDIRSIRRDYASGHRCWAALGRRYKVHGNTVRRIVLGLAWAHVS